MIPGIDGDRVDYKYINGASLRGLKGLSRFIKVAMEMGGSTTENFVFHDTGERLLERPCFPTEIKSRFVKKSFLKRRRTKFWFAIKHRGTMPCQKSCWCRNSMQTMICHCRWIDIRLIFQSHNTPAIKRLKRSSIAETRSLLRGFLEK